MPERRMIEGATAPLFDRLRLAKSAAEHQPLRALNRQELHASICREVAFLLNTRSPTLAADFAQADLTVRDYGIPDFTAFSPQDSQDRTRLAWLLTKAITAFEPRLQQVKVSVALLTDQPQALLLTMTACLAVARFTEPIALTAVLPHRANRDEPVTVQLQMPAVVA